MIKQIAIFVLLSGVFTNVYAQSKQEIQQLNQIKSHIKSSNEKIAKGYAYIQVYNFFGSRFNFIHQANTRCMEIVEAAKVAAGNLSRPTAFDRQYDPVQVFALIQAISNDVIYDQNVYQNLKSLEDEFKLQQFQIGDTLKFLTSGDDEIINRFPRPSDLYQDYGYQDNLLKAYREVAAKSNDKMRYYASKCTGSDLLLTPLIVQRKQFFRNLLKTLGDFYVENITDQYIEYIKDLAKPSHEIDVMLNVTSALDKLDRQYRDAALYEYDYLKSVSIIDSYESIATAILAKIVPLTLDPTMRTEATEEIQRRIGRASDYKKILEKKQPSSWLEDRFNSVNKKINAQRIACNGECVKKMSETKDLIAAAKIMELVSKDQIYVVLGNQLLDDVK